MISNKKWKSVFFCQIFVDKRRVMVIVENENENNKYRMIELDDYKCNTYVYKRAFSGAEKKTQTFWSQMKRL